ncbi:MAG: hypothetical protein WCK37_04845 [Candidatus Falkowbacteria bacterium]
MKKIIFPVALIMILTLTGCGVKSVANNSSVQTTSQIVTPTKVVNNSNMKSCSQTISGLKFSYPKNWGDCKVVDNKISFRTDFKKYNVDLIAEIREISKANVASVYSNFTDNTSFIKKEKIDGIDNSTIYNIACGGGIACTVLNIDDKTFYEINWDVASSQSVPKNADGVWVPDYSFTQDDVWNILKSVKN